MLACLCQLELTPSSEDGRLRYTGPEGLLTPELRAQLAGREGEILALLGRGGASKEWNFNWPRRPGLAYKIRATSSAQRRLWLLNQIEPENTSYNVLMAYRLAGPLNLPALRYSVAETVRRHEPLRTTFGQVAGQPVQVIHPFDGFEIEVCDLEEEGATPREENAASLIAEEATYVFNLQQGQLFRVKLIRLSPEEHILVVNVHHTVFDGWSTGILLGELSALYNACSANEPSPLLDLSVQYAEYAALEQEEMRNETWSDHLSYSPYAGGRV